jgi:hypothetical protein
MLTTAFSILTAIALLMPGFIIAELSLARSARASRSDLELALRAVAYALVVHLIFGWWTIDLVDRIASTQEVPGHWTALTAYVAIVLVGVPVALGVGLNRFLASWLIVELVDHTTENPRLVGGIYGQRSAIGQTPSPHDVYLQALCTVHEDENGVRTLKERLDPERGVYVAASRIARIDVLPDARDMSSAGGDGYHGGMSKNGSNQRLQEGALSALKTPTNPPAAPKLVPLSPAKRAGNSGKE